MPRLTKEALSQYIRTECKRQLRLNLSPDSGRYKAERQAEQMPPPQPPRPGLEHITQAGEKWQAEKLDDLTRAFGSASIICQRQQSAAGHAIYNPVSLASTLPSAIPGQFLVEAEYDVGPAFELALGIAAHRTTFSLDFGNVRPDIIEVLPSTHYSNFITPAGEVQPLPAGDARLQLRVIDIKLTAEPSPSYFAEVAYYSMVLAGWLIDNQMDGKFVVVHEGAVWPGSHDASCLATKAHELQAAGITPTPVQLRDALKEDLETVPFEVFVFRVRRFLQQDVPEVLSKPWKTLEWHVDHRCKGCENLGYPWKRQGQLTNHPDHCMPTAERIDHLSRVAFVPRGASAALRNLGITTVSSLARRSPTDPAFDAHQTLRATRTVVSGRATALQLLQPLIPSSAGTSAVMPKWADLRVYLSVDYDLGSAITFAFGAQAFWLEPRPFGTVSSVPRQTLSWAGQVFVVDMKDPRAEERELLIFLNHINMILTQARNRDAATTVQFYLWDSLQYKHLCRVVGRHLHAILNHRVLHHLAWLFPSEELLPNPTLTSRQSPLTIVNDVVRAVLAAPIPHFYSLLATARAYHPLPPAGLAPRFNIHPLFEDALSDQIPSERAHEIWTRSTTPYWGDQKNLLEETVQKRLKALEAVVRRLEDDLRPFLGQTAPATNIRPPQRRNRVSTDGQLWYAFAKLDAALVKLEAHQIRAMPPHEREARFHSARLPRRLSGAQEQQALSQLKLPHRVGRRVYELAPTSREVKLKEGDFSCALSPENAPGFLDKSFTRLAVGTPLQQVANNPRERMERVTTVTVVGLDRIRRLIALDADQRRPTILDRLEAAGIVDFAHDVVLDPVPQDFFTSKLLDALQALGNPAVARDEPLVQRALGQTRGRGANRTAHKPAADLLWDALAMHQTPVTRLLQPAQKQLQRHGLNLNSTQWTAWQEALSRRLQLIWGPPGTGKSRTARAIVVGAALEAHLEGRPLRILVSASTHTAMDNVVLPVNQDICALMPTAVEVHRIRSKWRQAEAHVPSVIDTELNRDQPSLRVLALQSRLQHAHGITIVGATPEQTHNLLMLNGGTAQREFFDLILIDEASHMDVPHAILPLCALASDGSVVLAGDPKQLPPIQQAEPPEKLEHLVGSIYDFVASQPGVAPVMLDQNYRSNDVLVQFSHRAEYPSTLSSYSPDLRLDLLSPLPTIRPSTWPSALHWSVEWSALLDPDRPATCFVYPEGRSSQWNQFEADAVAALIAVLEGRLSNQLCFERDPITGQVLPRSQTAYSAAEFWQQAIGVVTPHRAQQGLVIARLQQIFGGGTISPELIRNAVDTVERFQGQERDLMIATFALGDPDAIQSEDEFLLSLNRFNVMASRARAKLIVLVTQEIIDHLSADLDTLHGSRLLKLFSESFCDQSRPMTLGYVDNGTTRLIQGMFKWAQ